MRWLRWLLILVVLVVLVARAIAPLLLANRVERALTDLDGYRAQVRDVDLAIWRGAYRIEGVTIDRSLLGADETPFFYVESVDISVRWRSLLEGSIESQIVLEKPVLNFQRGPTEAESKTGEEGDEGDGDWRLRVQRLTPFEVSRLAVVDGFLHYIDRTRDPQIDVHVADWFLEVRNLTNVREPGHPGYAEARTTGTTIGDGAFDAKLAIDPLAETPRFDLEADLRGLDLTQLNDFFRAYGDFDVEEGVGDVYVELAAADGRLTGYVKPMMRDLDVLRWQGEEAADGVTDLFWEALVGATGEVVENQPRDTLAVRLPLEGSIESPNTDVWRLVTSLLTNAFIRALLPGIDHSVDLGDVPGVRFDR